MELPPSNESPLDASITGPAEQQSRSRQSDSLSELTTDAIIHRRPQARWSGQRRFKYFVTGVLAPIGCFAMVWIGMSTHVDAPWQSGKIDMYASLLLEEYSLLPFMPLLIFSMVAMTASCFYPKSLKWPAIRVGIYGGGILSIQYLLLIVFATSFFTFAAAVVVGPALALVTYVAAKLMPRARRIAIWQIMLLTAVVAAFAAGIAAMQQDVQNIGRGGAMNILLMAIFWTLVATPLLNCISYVRASVGLLRAPEVEGDRSKDQLQIWSLCSAWLLGFGASWKFSLDAMLAEYAKLPTVEPQCYVSAAAAHGHPRFVGVARIATEAAASDLLPAYPINLQMCRLKFLEFALAAAFPRVHRWVRWTYNALGPRAAAVCRSNVWLADASYVALKPLEWLAELLRMTAKVSLQRVTALYLRQP